MKKIFCRFKALKFSLKVSIVFVTFVILALFLKEPGFMIYLSSLFLLLVSLVRIVEAFVEGEFENETDND